MDPNSRESTSLPTFGSMAGCVDLDKLIALAHCDTVRKCVLEKYRNNSAKDKNLLKILETSKGLLLRDFDVTLSDRHKLKTHIENMGRGNRKHTFSCNLPKIFIGSGEEGRAENDLMLVLDDKNEHILKILTNINNLGKDTIIKKNLTFFGIFRGYIHNKFDIIDECETYYFCPWGKEFHESFKIGQDGSWRPGDNNFLKYSMTIDGIIASKRHVKTSVPSYFSSYTSSSVLAETESIEVISQDDFFNLCKIDSYPCFIKYKDVVNFSKNHNVKLTNDELVSIILDFNSFLNTYQTYQTQNPLGKSNSVATNSPCLPSHENMHGERRCGVPTCTIQ